MSTNNNLTSPDLLKDKRVRTYSPNSGRFLQQDPIGLNGGDTNLYRYVRNRPLSFTDPDGKNPLLALVGVGALIGGASGLLGDFIGNENFSFDSATSAFFSGAAGGAKSTGCNSASISSKWDSPSSSAYIRTYFATCNFWTPHSAK